MGKTINNIQLLALMLIIFLFTDGVVAQQSQLDKSKAVQESDELKSWLLGLPPSYTNKLWKKINVDQGNDQYLRKGLHSGNLVETAFLNRGQISDGYHGTSFPMNWPRGEGVQYGFLFDFFVAGEVVTINGDTIHFVSDCFKRNSKELAPDGSHWYFW